MTVALSWHIQRMRDLNDYLRRAAERNRRIEESRDRRRSNPSNEESGYKDSDLEIPTLPEILDRLKRS